MLSMTTQTFCTTPITSYPIKFLGGTLISMNSRMGWGIDSSSLTVELVEDCVAGFGYDAFSETIQNFGPDNFIGNDIEIIGGAAYFSLPAPNPAAPNDKFRFGGIITNWNTKLDNNGNTYSVTITDPKQILDNTIVILDSYSDLPFQHINYYNVYSAFEAGVNYGNCNVFGTANSTERGMNYRNILKGLLALAALNGDTTNFRLPVYSPTTNSVGYPGLFKLDLGFTLTTNDIYTAELSQTRADSMPLGPENYRITDKLSLLELIQNICQTTGRDFYANLYWDPIKSENVIKLSTVNLQQPLSSIGTIVPAYKGYSTNLAYGKELRNEKSRKLVFGDQIHYLLNTTEFTPYFGEDDFGNPIYPIRNEDGAFAEPDGQTESNCGFWIYIDIRKLNLSLYNIILDTNKVPINKLWISEIDIRSALSSYDLWLLRTLAKSNDPNHYSKIDNSLVKILQNAPVYKDLAMDGYTESLINVLSRGPNTAFDSSRSPVQDTFLNARRELAKANEIDIIDDLDKIHKFISNLGQTYYGKQFLTRLNKNICVTIDNEEGGGNGFGEKIYSETPTNDGGWVDYNVPVLGLLDPNLGIFRSDDDRIKPFAMFSSTTSETNLSSSKTGEPDRSSPSPAPTPPTPPST
jgi:hypothetical protein